MTHHDHQHQHQHQHHHQHQHQHGHQGQKYKGLHKDWRTWVVVGLMLAAMVIYVLSMDESLAPNAPPGQEMPAAPAAP